MLSRSLSDCHSLTLNAMSWLMFFNLPGRVNSVTNSLMNYFILANLASDALEEIFLYLIKKRHENWEWIMDISEKVRLEEGFWFSPQADYIVFLTINSTKVICNLEKFSIFQRKPAKTVSIMLLFTFSGFLFMSPNFVCFSIELHWQLFKGDKNVATKQCCHQSGF